MRITCMYDNFPVFIPEDHEIRGIGGTENFAVYVSRNLAWLGHDVSFYNKSEIEPTNFDGVMWANVSHYNPSDSVDIVISFRMREIFQQDIAAKLKVLILADTESVGLGDDVRAGKIDVVMPVSKWQMDKIAKEEDLVGHACWMLASNGIDGSEFANDHEKITGKCIHLSTPERGLGLLLDVWPEIECSRELNSRGIFPELHLFSSFMGWGVPFKENEIMSQVEYAKVEALKSEGYIIHNHKHASRAELRQHQYDSDVFLYPTNFLETYCISLTEVMAAGVIPVVSNKAAMSRIADGRTGFLVGNPEDDAYSDEMKKDFTGAAVMALLLSDNTKRLIREAAKKAAIKHDYSVLVKLWAEKWAAKI